MSGKTNLNQLLSSMAPELLEGEYVFVTIAGARYGDYAELQAIATMQEQEGLTLVVLKQAAVAANLGFDSVFRCITLTVHSSLDAVGLTAAFSTKLAEHGISANVIAGYYHDHIFVPANVAEQAVEALLELT